MDKCISSMTLLHSDLSCVRENVLSALTSLHLTCNTLTEAVCWRKLYYFIFNSTTCLLSNHCNTSHARKHTNPKLQLGLWQFNLANTWKLVSVLKVHIHVDGIITKKKVFI